MSAHVVGAFALAAGLATVSSSIVAAETAAVRCGKAAWFAPGGTTASGEPSRAGDLTAAHRTLPFGTEVQVDNLGNGQSVVVRVNDRGPSTRSRIISVSRAAAESLGMTSDGVAQVRLTVLGDDQSPGGGCGDAAKAPASEAAELLPAGPPAGDAIADRFAVAFEPESWEESELRKLLEALLPRLYRSKSVRSARSAFANADAADLDRARSAANVEIPWPALDGLTQVSLPAASVPYLWSTELTMPHTARFEPAGVAVAVSQLTYY